MSTIETIEQPVLGEQGEPCQECGTPLAADQRYCLNCGARRAAPRVDLGYVNAGGSAGAPPPGTPAATSAEGRDWTPIIALGGLVALGLMLAVGVLIGEGGNGGGSETTPAPIVNVGSDTGGGSSTTASGGSSVDTANTSFKSDWPAGKEGYTVELGTLPKQGTSADQVDSAKADATSKGAPDVGALDSDDYASLPSGNYIVYSGVYTSKADADKALKSLKSKFPDAKVVQVSTKASSGGGGGGTTANSAQSLTSAKSSGDQPVTASDQALQQLDSASGSDYQKQSQKLPDEIQTEGKPPPTDNKPAGGGSGGGVVIK
jgi:hypothetical protein